jgi:hypothetical protein
LIFLLTFFIKEKSEAPPARRSNATMQVAIPEKLLQQSKARPARPSYKTSQVAIPKNHRDAAANHRKQKAPPQSGSAL